MIGNLTDMRGDDIFALARKETSVIEKYPDRFYYKYMGRPLTEADRETSSS